VARRLFSTREFLASGRTEKELRWGVRKGFWVSVVRGFYADGPEPPGPFEIALARMLSADGMESGLVGAKLHGFDGIVIPTVEMPRRRRVAISPEPVLVDDVWCTDGLQTLVDIASLVDDLVFEQALESALYKRRLKLEEFVDLIPLLAASRTAGAPRIKRVLALRPTGAPPTESLLETLMVQLARQTPGVPEPTRQLVIEDEDGDFVARVDLAWPDDGGFGELDGQHHKDQPVYDAVRQTNVAIATGWICGRFTWNEVRRNPVTTGRRLVKFIARGRNRRPRDS
jgi:hypothetical protein